MSSTLLLKNAYAVFYPVWVDFKNILSFIAAKYFDKYL
jgi:hypothetical protein